MKKFHYIYIFIFTAIFFFGCSKSEPKIPEQAKNLVGQSFKSALGSPYLVSSSFSLITEPPFVYRFASGENINGEEIALYVTGTNTITDLELKTKISDFHPKKIDGVAIKHKGKWVKYGEGVISYYHLNL